MNNLQSRIEALEKEMVTEEWEDHEIHIIGIDGSLAGRDTPGRLSIVIKSGRPGKPGRSYYRKDTESEEAFLERIEAEEAVRASQDAPR